MTFLAVIALVLIGLRINHHMRLGETAQAGQWGLVALVVALLLGFTHG